MSDKASPSHIERTWYVDRHVSPGDSIHYDRWEDREDLATRCGECFGRGTTHDNSWRDIKCPECAGTGRVKPTRLTVIGATECSDYSGNALVGESNYRTMKAEFPWLVEIYGSHGYKVLAYLGKRENQSDALIEAIDALADYPLYDESDHSDLECERESEAWSESYGGEHDFKRALARYFDEIDERDCPDCDEDGYQHCDQCNDHVCGTCGGTGTIAYEHDEDKITDALIAAAALPRRWYSEPMSSVWDLWREGCEVFNVNGGSGYVNEQGDSIFFMIGKWIDSARKPNYPGWSDSYKESHDTMRAHLATLATMCRISDDEQGA